MLQAHVSLCPMNSKRQIFDVAVIGGGPSGACAALDLARYGFKVILLERKVLPRYKACGGGLVVRARALLPPRVRDTIEHNCNTIQINVLDTSFSYLLRRPYSVISMVMRDKFDYEFVMEARSAGAQLLDGCKVLDLNYQPDGIEIYGDKGIFFAKYIIGADGVTSFTARKAGFPKLDYLMPALECEVAVEKRVFDRYLSKARFDFNVLPQGYGWVFPKKEQLSVGVGRIRKGKGNLETYLERYLRFLGITGQAQKIEKKGWQISVYPRETFVKNRTILVGDAAGLVDPVMGEGISRAVLSGKLAALSIRQGRFDESRVKKLYENKLKREILDDYKWGRVVAKWLYDSKRFRKLLFAVYGRQMCEAMVDIMAGKRNYEKILKNPLTYLRLLRPVDKGR